MKMNVIPGYVNTRPGILVGTKLEGPVTMGEDGEIRFDEEGIRFLLEMGVEWVMVGSRQVPKHDADTYLRMREGLEARGDVVQIGAAGHAVRIAQVFHDHAARGDPPIGISLFQQSLQDPIQLQKALGTPLDLLSQRGSPPLL